MNKIECEICMDLIPLVKDGIASEESYKAVEAHVKECETCRKLYGENQEPAQITTDENHAWKQIQKKWIGFFFALLCVGIVFGVSLTNQAEMFYNSLIMPIAGGCGYLIFQKRAVYKVPILLLILYAAMNVFQFLRGVESLDFYSMLVWVAIYSIFAILGVGIAGLFHHARQTKKTYRFLANSMGILLIIGLCLFANALVGNPISKAIVTKQAKVYLEKNYKEKEFKLKKVSYNFKDGNYFAHMERPNSMDLNFTVSLDMFGNIVYDDYAFRIEGGSNTQDRLWKEYRELTDSLLLNWKFPYHGEIIFGDLDFSNLDIEFIPDKIYDVRELGKEAGTLVLYIEDPVVTKEQANEIMQDIKKQFDEAGIPFRYMDFTLEYPRDKAGQESISMGTISYDEIP